MLTSRSRLLYVGVVFGVACAALSAYHGIGEVLQGDYTPNSFFFNAWRGPNCNINYCFTAFTPLALIPTSMQVVGSIVLIWSTVVLGITVLVWLNKARWYSLVAASLILLLLGGGGIAPILGIMGGILMHYGRKGEVAASAQSPAHTKVVKFI